MSKLSDLIAQLCPHGVEFKPIKNVFTRLRGTPITATKMKEIANFNGDIRIFAGGKTVINAFESDIPNANIINVPAVLVQSRGVIDFVFYEKPFTFKNEMWAYTNKEKTFVKFLYYVLKNNVKYFRDAASKMGSLPQISLAVTEEFKIPVPPLEVQKEIVRILDIFTELTAELTAELTLRKKQYEFYREKLLTFDAATPTLFAEQSRAEQSRAEQSRGVIFKKLGEVAKIRRGVRVVRSQLSENGKYAVYQNSMTPLGYYENFNCNANTTFVISAGAAGEIGYSYKNFWAADDCLYIECDKNFNSRFLYYLLLCQQKFIYSNVRRASVPRLSKEVIQNLKIPVPPIEEQARIVKILDKFDKLCNDLSEGLPAEILLRKKQYEFYREKLLTFEEKI